MLAVTATDNTGQSADTSANITLDTTAPLSMSQPPDQSLVQFPVNLAAQSGKPYNTVSFYYEDAAGTTS